MYICAQIFLFLAVAAIVLIAILDQVGPHAAGVCAVMFGLIVCCLAHVRATQED